MLIGYDEYPFEKVLLNPKFKVSEQVVYATIRELLAARRPNVFCGLFQLAFEGGIGIDLKA